MLGLGEARADVLGGAGDAGVSGVEVEVGGLDHVAADDRALEEVDVLERIDHAAAS